MFPLAFLAVAALLMPSCSSETETSGGGASLADPALTEAIVSADFTAGEKVFTGAKRLNAEQYLKLEQAKMARSFSGVGEELLQKLPERADLSDELPPVGDQGRQGSCAGWSVGYAVKSFQERREHGWDFSPEHLFSPTFLYNQANGGVDEGAFMTDILKVLGTVGAVPLKLMPYDQLDFTTQPSLDLKTFAGNFRALDFRRLDSPELGVIKAYLAAGDPVVLELALYANFDAHGMRQSGNVYSKGDGEPQGYHFITAVGYDDGKRAVRLMNSWGKSWGENGYGWLDYDFLPKAVDRAYVVYDLPTPSPAVAYLDEIADSAKAGELLASAPLRETDRSVPVADIPSSADDNSAVKAAQAVPVLGVNDMLIVVPEEAGITMQGTWARLGDELEGAWEFLSERTSPAFKDFMREGDDIRVAEALLEKGKVGKMFFMDPSRLPVFTSLGATFKTPRAEIHRLYRAPDITVTTADVRSDTYFYHSISRDWGGIKLTTHAALIFYYNPEDEVAYFSLESVFKDVAMGTAFKTLNAGESAVAGDGTLIDSAEGGISFTVPKRFSETNKSVWPGTGVGYFIKDPLAFEDSITVKVFEVSPTASGNVLDSRMQADAEVFGPDLSQAMGTRQVSGLTFSLAGDKDGKHLRCYALKDGRIYQLQMTSSGDEKAPVWTNAVLDSVLIK